MSDTERSNQYGAKEVAEILDAVKNTPSIVPRFPRPKNSINTTGVSAIRTP